jgi:hypothetical protein
MQFDPVGRDPGLAVGPVEETYAAQRRLASHPFELDRGRDAARSNEGSAGLPHLESGLWGGAAGACRLRELDDHRPCESARVGDHEMDVVVALKLCPDQRCSHKVGGRLDTAVTRRVVEAGRRVETAKRTDRGRLGSRVDEPCCWVCQRFDGPAPSPAGCFNVGCR